MSVFEHKEYKQHEQLVFFNRPEVGLKAIVAIHNTQRGPALGGCRIYPYASTDDALEDVLRLSLGMTYKSAISGLPLGGGKSVIIADPQKDKSEALLLAFGQCLEQLGGRYIVAEDSGTTVDDIKIMATQTAHVSGIQAREKAHGGIADGDPSPATAYGVFMGIKAAVEKVLQRDSLEGLRVAVQGIGAVGHRLIAQLVQTGAEVIATDINIDIRKKAAENYAIKIVRPEEIFSQDVDVFAPCALGAILNKANIARLKASIVAGAANNQLAVPESAQLLQARNILYIPDFAINAGGVIDIAGCIAGLSHADSIRQVAGIHATVLEIIDRAAAEGCTTNDVALRMAEKKMQEPVDTD